MAEFKDGLKAFKSTKRNPEQQNNWDSFWAKQDKTNDRKSTIPERTGEDC